MAADDQIKVHVTLDMEAAEDEVAAVAEVFGQRVWTLKSRQASSG